VIVLVLLLVMWLEIMLVGRNMLEKLTVFLLVMMTGDVWESMLEYVLDDVLDYMLESV